MDSFYCFQSNFLMEIAQSLVHKYNFQIKKNTTITIYLEIIQTPGQVASTNTRQLSFIWSGYTLFISLASFNYHHNNTTILNR